MFFDEKALSNRNTRNKYLIRLHKSPGIMASGVSIKLLPENSNELCDRWKLILQEKQVENNSDRIDKEITAIAYKILKHKRISTKQRSFSLPKCLN